MEKLVVEFNKQMAFSLRDAEAYLHDINLFVDYFKNNDIGIEGLNKTKCDFYCEDDSNIAWVVCSDQDKFFSKNKDMAQRVFDEIVNNVKGGLFSNFAFGEGNDGVYEEQYPYDEPVTYEPYIAYWTGKMHIEDWDGKSKSGWF